MADAKRLVEADAVLAQVSTTLAAIQALNDGDENEHLLSYACDGLYSAEGYLQTYRRRLEDPNAD